MGTIVHIPAGRSVRANFLARRSLFQLVLRLRKPPCEWPGNLAKAGNILCTELKLSESEARDLMIQSVSAAQHCVVLQNRQSVSIARTHVPAVIEKVTKIIFNCIKRAPADLRKTLDQAVTHLLQCSDVELELIESIFEATARIFKQYPNIEPSVTALKALEQLPGVHYAALNPTSRQRAEKAIADLSREGKKATAAQIFEILTETVGDVAVVPVRSSSFDLIVNYVFDLIAIWRRAQLPTGRARNDADPLYKSKFHRYADLVLAAVCEPRARRHHTDLANLRQQLRAAHAKLPREAKNLISISLPRADTQWMVSEAHIKVALRRAQISALKSP